jgi:hypothetical protein
MLWVRLPWLSARLDRPVLASIEALCGEGSDGLGVPPGALVLRTRWPSAHVMVLMPAAVPGGECWESLDPDGKRATDVAWERWVDRLLQEAIDRPRLSEADVQRLGPDRDVLAMALLRAWFWIDDAAWGAFARGRGLTDRLAFPALPSPGMCEALKLMAKTFRRTPAELLKQPLPEFVFNYQVSLRREPKELAAEALADEMSPHG